MVCNLTKKYKQGNISTFTMNGIKSNGKYY